MNLENLPVELQRNFALMLDLDSRARELMRGIDRSADDYLSNINGWSSDKKTDAKVTIQRRFDKAKEYCDDKVQLAIQTYELVDKHIRKLDSDLARFEVEIQDKAISIATKIVEESSQKRGRKKITKDNETKNKKASSEEKTVTKKNSKKKSSKKNGKMASVISNKTSSGALTNSINPISGVVNAAAEMGSLSSSLVGAGVTHSAEVLDMPVDPNEPTYCLCNQVSYGEMIGCDNPDCPIEWFHFACVKLTTKPKGKWFCPKCITDKKKK